MFFFTLLIRLPLYHTDFWRTPDAIEYLNVANQINAGQGLTQSIKWHFFTDSPVVTSAFEGKPFLTSLIFVPILAIFHDPYSLQLFLFVVMAAVVVIFYLISRKFVSPFFAFLLSLLVALNPNIFINNRLLLSEPLFYLFVLCALYFFLRKNKSIYDYSLIGFFTALSYMTRNEGLLLLFVFLLCSFRKIKQTGILLGVFLLTALPYLVGNYLVNGNPFYSYNAYHFRVEHFSEGMLSGYGKVFPSASEFISNHSLWIIHKFFELIWGNILWLVGWSYFGLLSLFLLFVGKKEIIKRFGVFILFAVLIIFNYSIFWSAFLSADRYLGLVFILFLIPLGYGISKLSETKKVIAIAMIILTMGVYVAYDIHRTHWARIKEQSSDLWRFEKKEQLYKWIIRNTGESEIVASESPWLVYLFTNNPTILLPNLDNQTAYNSFIDKYNVSFMLSERQLPYKKMYSSDVGIIYQTR